jgi:hypothetical protein
LIFEVSRQPSALLREFAREVLELLLLQIDVDLHRDLRVEDDSFLERHECTARLDWIERVHLVHQRYE